MEDHKTNVSPLNTDKHSPENEQRTFHKIVENEDDLEGMIAYSIYKKEKIEWIERESKIASAPITNEYLKAHFYPHFMTPTKVLYYRERAMEMLDISFDREVKLEVAELIEDMRQELIGTYLDQKTKSMSDNISNAVINTVKDLNKSRRRGLYDGVIASIVGAVFIYSFTFGYSVLVSKKTAPAPAEIKASIP